MADESEQPGGDAWGDDISDERKAELEQRLQAWEREVDHGELKGPFDPARLPNGEWERLQLTGADVFWLAARTQVGTSEAQAVAEQMELLRRGRDNPWLRFELRVDGLHLEGADLQGTHLERAVLKEAHLERAVLHGAHLARGYLEGAHLEGAYLGEAHLEGAYLGGAHLEGALLNDAYLEGAYLGGAHLEVAQFGGAHLERADLSKAHLEGAYLGLAYLEKADFRLAHLEGAYLMWAHLEGAYLSGAHLEGMTYHADNEDYQRIQHWVSKGHPFSTALSPVDLRGAFFDSATDLRFAVLGEASSGGIAVADIHWGDVNLAAVDWSKVGRLGDEREARDLARIKKPVVFDDTGYGKALTRLEWRAAQQAIAGKFQDAARANRQLATALRSQGLADEADRFAYQAQVLQRQVLRWQRKWGQWGVQTALALIAGYGYRLWRILAAYGTILLLFTVVYWRMGVHSFSHEPGWQALWDSFLVSLSAIHGRTMLSSWEHGVPLHG